MVGTRFSHRDQNAKACLSRRIISTEARSARMTIRRKVIAPMVRIWPRIGAPPLSFSPLGCQSRRLTLLPSSGRFQPGEAAWAICIIACMARRAPGGIGARPDIATSAVVTIGTILRNDPGAAALRTDPAIGGT